MKDSQFSLRFYAISLGAEIVFRQIIWMNYELFMVFNLNFSDKQNTSFNILKRKKKKHLLI